MQSEQSDVWLKYHYIMTKIPSKWRRTNHISQNKFRQNFWLIVWQRGKMDFLKRIELESSYFKATLFAAIPKKLSGQPILDTKYVLKEFLSASLFFQVHPLTYTMRSHFSCG